MKYETNILLQHILQKKLFSKEIISELNKKLYIVTRMGNADLANQIRLALENYNSMYRAKSDELFKKQTNNRGTNFDDIIDIS